MAMLPRYTPSLSMSHAQRSRCVPDTALRGVSAGTTFQIGGGTHNNGSRFLFFLKHDLWARKLRKAPHVASDHVMSES